MHAVGGSFLGTQPFTGYRASLQTPSPCDSYQRVVVSLIPSSQMGKWAQRISACYLPKVKYWGSEGGRGARHTTPRVEPSRWTSGVGRPSPTPII